MQRGGGLLERDEMNAGREKGKRRGGCMLPPPSLPQRRGEQLRGREPIAVQPQNKGAVHWLLPPAYRHLVLGFLTLQGPPHTQKE